jgi:hypothetical protein
VYLGKAVSDDDCGALASDARNRLPSERDDRCQDGRRHCPFVARGAVLVRLQRRTRVAPKQNSPARASRRVTRLRLRENHLWREAQADSARLCS